MEKKKDEHFGMQLGLLFVHEIDRLKKKTVKRMFGRNSLKTALLVKSKLLKLEKLVSPYF